MLHGLTTLLHSALSFCFHLTGNYGWAIILLTLVIRLVLMPLMLWGQRGSQKSAALQKEVQSIQSSYKGEEAERRLQEVYRRSAGSMLAGCLPMLAQWPVLLAMYSALSTFAYALPAGFFWLSNLSAPDPYFVLPLLVIGTQLWQSLATLPKEQRLTALILPVVFGFMLVKASAAVSLYWLASNLVSLVQFYLFRPRPQVA